MDSDSGDLLLKMVLTGTTAIDGASQTVLTSPGRMASPLAKGFTAGQMMEIDAFSLRLGTSGIEPGSKPPPPVHENHFATNSKEEEDKRQSIGALARKGGYQAWRGGNMAIKYPLDIQPITFERPADMSSKQLIQCCIDCTSFDSAAIIKRKPVGSDAQGEIYMRIDFTGVLVIKVDWADEDDYVKETVSFIARAITFTYRPQTSSGGLGASVSRFWSMLPDLKQEKFS
jgi:type VI protein secretion system component Hcp